MLVFSIQILTVNSFRPEGHIIPKEIADKIYAAAIAFRTEEAIYGCATMKITRTEDHVTGPQITFSLLPPLIKSE